jgi:hypothetical protein
MGEQWGMSQLPSRLWNSDTSTLLLTNWGGVDYGRGQSFLPYPGSEIHLAKHHIEGGVEGALKSGS